MTDFSFPENPFNDIQPSDFNKLNKKHVTEDYVEENFKRLGWTTYKPFNDTGIDRIVTKYVCPNGHTPLDEKLNGPCPVCGSKPIKITRFIQVKTRSLKNSILGFTLKSKDIRVDPRHVFLLYSDNTSKEQQDFLIIGVKDYLNFFYVSKDIKNPFAPMSFRKGNNKLNSLKYDSKLDSWSWSKHSWECYRNKAGLAKIQNPLIDLNLKDEIRETRNLANQLLYSFSPGKSYSNTVKVETELSISDEKSKYYKTEVVMEVRKKTTDYLKEHCSKEVYDSSMKYFEFVKISEMLGDTEDTE